MARGKAKRFRGPGDVEPAIDDEAQIVAVDRRAFTSFAEGRFADTCECYTPSAQRQIAAMLGTSDCVQAWRELDARLRASLTPEQFTAVTSRSIASVELKGTTAVGRYPALPTSLLGLRGIADTVTMRKIDGGWKIDRVPSGRAGGGRRGVGVRALLTRRLSGRGG